MSILGYVVFSNPFDLEMDASLQGLGTVLSQRAKNGKIRMLPYARKPLHLNESVYAKL